MKRYLLDTSVCINLIKHDAHVVSKIMEVGQENCFVSEMTLAELAYGAWKSKNPKHFRDMEDVKRAFEILPINPAIDDYGRIKATLEQKGQRIDEFDLMIGATALCSNCVMVTHNVKHFERIPFLEVENWTR